MPCLRFTVRVKPGSSRARVGGSYGDVEPALVVAVNAPPVDGAANDAVVVAVAKALGVRRGDITILSGQHARTKVLEVQCDDPDALSRMVADLLDG